MLSSNNKTLFGEWSSEKTILVATWRFLILITSLAGNVTILTVVTRYHAIKLGQVTTTFIGHLAASDLGLALFVMTPVLGLSLVPDSRVNHFLCSAVCFTCIVFISSSMLLVCLFNISKIATIVFPLRSRAWTSRSAHVVVALSWAWCGLSAISYVNMGGETVYYDYRIRCCMVTTNSEGYKWFSVFKTLVGVGVPGILIILSTLWLLSFSQRQAKTHGRSSLQFQSAVTAISIATTYCLSYVPFFIYQSLLYFTLGQKQFYTTPSLLTEETTMVVVVEYDKFGTPMSGFIYTDFYLMACLLTFLNTGVNFFIYLASITSFRQFIVRRLERVWWGRSDRVPLSARQDLLSRRRVVTFSFHGIGDTATDICFSSGVLH
ncbi:hypothetical protein ACHWQZ_G003906 [Mnemiopsis leidyi]